MDKFNIIEKNEEIKRLKRLNEIHVIDLKRYERKIMGQRRSINSLYEQISCLRGFIGEDGYEELRKIYNEKRIEKNGN